MERRETPAIGRPAAEAGPRSARAVAHGAGCSGPTERLQNLPEVGCRRWKVLMKPATGQNPWKLLRFLSKYFGFRYKEIIMFFPGSAEIDLDLILLRMLLPRV